MQFLARSTSWRDGDGSSEGTAGPMNGQQQQQSSSPPSGGGGVNQVPSSTITSKAPALYKKSWDEDHLPEWATEEFDYGGTFDSAGAFHDSERDSIAPENVKLQKGKIKPDVKKEEPIIESNEIVNDPSPPLNHFDTRNETSSVPSKFIDFLSDREAHQSTNFNVAALKANFNGTVPNPSTHIDRMQEVADLVANLIMEDDTKEAKVPVEVVVPPQPGAPQTIMVDWFYRDPQGDTQGPFSAQDMSEWYKAGYFQESLMVRRSIDGAFMPLGQLVKVYGRNAPFLAATMMEPIQAPPPPPPAVEIDPYRVQQQQQQQRMAPPDVNGWNMMTPEQQIILLNMRMAQRVPAQDPYAMKAAAPANVPTPLDLRRMMGNTTNEFYQPPVQTNVPPAPVQNQEMDPIQQLLMQLQKTGGNAVSINESAQQWMKPPQMMVQPSVGANNLELAQSTNVTNQHVGMHQNQAPPQNNWNQAPMSIWDMPKSDNVALNQHNIQQQQQQQQPSQSQMQVTSSELDNVQNGSSDDSGLQFQTAPMKSHDSKKKRQKEDLVDSKKQSKEVTPQPKQAVVINKKKPVVNEKQQKKEERSTQPAAIAPWVGQTNANGASLAKIQKTEAQRRQGEMAAQREREHHKMEMIQKMEVQKNDGLKWAAPPTARVKTLDEIQAEEQKAASIQQEKENVAYAKREAAKKEATVVTNDISIWNSTPHSMAWQQPKVWSGEQTSGSGFWEEPVKPTTNNIVGKTTQLLSKSQTMATITTTKKQAPVAVKKQAPPMKRPAGERKEKKEDHNNEFTSWCTRTLSSMNGNVDGKLCLVSYLK